MEVREAGPGWVVYCALLAPGGGPAVVLEPPPSADSDASAPWCQPGDTLHTATTNTQQQTNKQTNTVYACSV